jgi:amino acid permease
VDVHERGEREPGKVISALTHFLPSKAWGILAYTFWGIMVLFSTRLIRDRWHSTFIWVHIVCFCISMVALCVHRPQLSPYLIAGCALYS